MQAATLAAHRFGFSEPSLRPLSADPRGWVLGQMRQPAALDAAGLMGSAEAIQLGRRVLQTAQTNRAQTQLLGSAMNAAVAPQPEPDPARRQLRAASLRGLQRRWQHVVATPTPVYERWVLFWANHFTVAGTKAALVGLVLPFEREAIRPAVTGPFVALLRAATLHPAMLLYLDNAQSIGPHSRAGLRRSKGLNENLARELLELHTLGVNGGYTQADVTELAKLLTGWSVDRSEGGTGQVQFVASWHEPGPKRVLGKTYADGPQALDALLLDLSRHPRTARHIATQLVRHFVSDEPAPALVDAVAARFTSSDGDLGAVADALFSHELAWRADTPAKFKRPEEWLLSAHRVLQLPVTQPERLLQTLTEMGQEVGKAPSPAGWPDRSADWLAPDALWKRVAWAGRFGNEHATRVDARLLATQSLGADLREDTRLHIERAESNGQALALCLLSPEFQRR